MGETRINFVASDEAFLESIGEILSYKGDTLGIDVETNSLDYFTASLILLQVGNNEFVNVYKVDSVSPKHLNYLFSLLENKVLIGHNIKFDMKILRNSLGKFPLRVYDTMVAESIINAGIGITKQTEIFSWKHKARYSLEELANKYASTALNKEIRKKFLDENLNITPELIEYAAKDVAILFPIYNAQMAEIQKRKLLRTVNLEMQLLPVIADMEYAGVTLDKEEWANLLVKAKETTEVIRQEMIDYLKEKLTPFIEENGLTAYDLIKIFEVTTKTKKKQYFEELAQLKTPDEIFPVFFDLYNVNSNNQMLLTLHFLGVESRATGSKELKRDYKGHPFVDKLIEYREWAKKVTSFGENFFEHIHPKTGKIHTDYNQLGTGTGRLSSDNPNLQNIKKDPAYRKSFKAGDGNSFLTADYSQIELRIAAELSQDPVMVSAFNSNDDLHAITASSIYAIDINALNNEQRSEGKGVNFAVLYGTSARGLAYNFQIPLEIAQERLDRFYNTYPELMSFISGVHHEILTRGYSVTPLGRKRYFILPVKWTKKNYKLMFRVMREGFNHVIQGGSADMIKIAMCKIFYDNPFGNRLQLVLTVHDEIVVEAANEILDEAQNFVKEKMLESAKLFIKTIPVEVDIKPAPYWLKS